jgi:hypothetical protein
VSLIKKVLNGEINREKIASAVEAVASGAAEPGAAQIPTQCTACGAPIDEAITRGQQQVECEYCGTIMRW